MQINAATILLLVSVATTFHTYSDGYIIYLTKGGKVPTTYQPKQSSQLRQTSCRTKNSLSNFLIDNLISNDLLVPTFPVANTAYYQQQQQPSTSLVRFFDDFEKEFRDFDRDFFLDAPRLSRGFPSVSSTSIDMDIRETPKEYVISADIPGVSKSDIDVTVERGRILEISAERKSNEESSDDSKYKRQERYYGKTTRAMELPDDCDEDNIKAKYQNGVLEIHIPKVQKVQQKPNVKKIDIAAVKTAQKSVEIPKIISTDTTPQVLDTLAREEGPKQTGVASRAGTVVDAGHKDLSVTEDEKLPTDGPAQETPINGPTLVHASYA